MTFNRLFVGILAGILLFGVILPYMISAASNELTALGFCVMIGVSYFVGNSINNLFKKKMDG